MATNEIRRGFRTSEFWLSTIATITGIVLASGALDSVPADAWINKLIGCVLAGLAAFGYGAIRAKVKINESNP